MSKKIAALLAALVIAVGLPACADSASEEGVGGDTGGGQEQESGTDGDGY